ncbi:MAG: hypothetical protein DWI28_02825 [Planctomycetota bacterium]|nr:MAG: hypothetical protein DWI28_02825 [Planctomycetota bacterium]
MIPKGPFSIHRQFGGADHFLGKGHGCCRVGHHEHPRHAYLRPVVRLHDCRLHDCCLHDCRLHDCCLHDCRLHDCRLHDCRLRDCRLRVRFGF